MSITIKGASSGGVDIVAPASGSNLTLTLPSTTGTVSLVGGAVGLSLNDNVKAKFGTGNDVEIYHDGSNSFIDDTGTGDLYLRGSSRVLIGKYTGETMIVCNQDASVDLKHNDLNKLSTTSTGCSVTGTLAATAVTGDGSGLTNMPAAGFKSWQIFTSSGTWTKPSGITLIKAYITGGGGGGSNVANNDDASGGGGGGGGTAIKVIDVSGISSVTVTIGSGGAATSAGSTSSFGSHCSGSGGAPGWNGDSNGNLGGGGGGGGSNGDMNIRGSAGVTGEYYNEIAGGAGGSSFWGGAGNTQSHYSGPHVGIYGGGGGGRNSKWASLGSGASAGGDGICVVEEFA
jgi:hypothetical protein